MVGGYVLQLHKTKNNIIVKIKLTWVDAFQEYDQQIRVKHHFRNLTYEYG